MQVSCAVHIVHVFAMIMNDVTTDNLRFRIDIVYANVMCTIDAHINMYFNDAFLSSIDFHVFC